MPQFSLFKSLENRALTGKPIAKSAEKLALIILRERACLANAKADAISESLYYLKMAAEYDCPYSSFVLGCVYLGPILRKPEKKPYDPEWYNLFNGCIYNCYNQQNKQEFINLTVLDQNLKPDLEKAHHYFQMAAKLNNPQALLWLSRLALSNSVPLNLSDLSFSKLYASMAIAQLPREPDVLIQQFDFDEILYLCEWNPCLANELLCRESFVQFLLEPDEQLRQNNIDILYRLLTVSPEVAIKFLDDEQFLLQFNPYQKTEMLHNVLVEYPELYAELRQVFCCKRHKY